MFDMVFRHIICSTYQEIALGYFNRVSSLVRNELGPVPLPSSGVNHFMLMTSMLQYACALGKCAGRMKAITSRV
jgi:hypothetical protein